MSFFLRRLVNQMDKIETKVDRNERRMWRVMDKLNIAEHDDGD